MGASPAPPLGLSRDQQHRLAAGEVVVLDALPPAASKSARGGTALALVRASPEQVWRVLVDYRGHTRFYPRVVGVEVLEADDRHALVRYEVGIGPFSFAFRMNKYPDPHRRRIEWQLADGHANSLFRENSGYWQVDETEDATRIVYAIGVRTILPAFLTLGAERQSLVDTINALRDLVEDGKGPRRADHVREGVAPGNGCAYPGRDSAPISLGRGEVTAAVAVSSSCRGGVG
jgi:ribosome-associated toxin RatA of RatAB toxin-antitoxin module